MVQLHKPLRELILKTGYNLTDSCMNHLPFLPSLTNLIIEKTKMLTIDLEMILILCLLLETVHISIVVISAVRNLCTEQQSE
jgi:hypothetical protein